MKQVKCVLMSLVTIALFASCSTKLTKVNKHGIGKNVRCRMEAQVGSNLKKRVCRTVEETKQRKEMDKRQLQKLQYRVKSKSGS